MCARQSQNITTYEHTQLCYSFKYNQQDATLYNILYCCQCSACFRQFFRPLSGAQRYTVFFIAVNALHVSGGFSALHQELNVTQYYLLLSMLCMFQAVFPPIIRSSNYISTWRMSSLLAATASMGGLAYSTNSPTLAVEHWQQ